MTQAKQKKTMKRIMLPKGEAKWFKLIKPDVKYNKYQVDIVVEDSEAIRQIINQADEMVEETLKAERTKLLAEGKKAQANDLEKAKASKLPIKKEYTKEGEETGRFVIRVSKDSIHKKTQTVIPPITILNPAAKQYSSAQLQTLRVNNGSIVKLQVLLSTYVLPAGTVGYKLSPDAAQIVEFATSSFDSDLSGFGVEGEDDTVDMEQEFSDESDSKLNDDF